MAKDRGQFDDGSKECGGDLSSFKHSGDLGDIIFALPTIKALGGGRLYLSKLKQTRELMSPEKLEFLRGLLECQDYIKSVEIWNGEGVGYDLDQFRDQWDAHADYGQTLAGYHAVTFGLKAEIADVPWIVVGKKEINKVVIHRSARYHGKYFPWRKVVEAYGQNIVMVGLRDEHATFEKAFGKVDFYQVSDALEMAEIINGGKLWISNQSFPESLAEGLKKAKILEVPDIVPLLSPFPTSIYARSNAQYVFSKNIYLPKI